MKIKTPKNLNYSGTIVEIKNLIPLDNCDNIIHTNIFGNLVIVSKSINIGDVGVFFPIETQLSDDYLKNNNLYRDKDLNLDSQKSGYFEKNGRIKAMKFKGHKSMGYFDKLDTLNFVLNDDKLNIGDEFDELNNILICKKYIPVIKNTQGSGNNKKKPNTPKVSKIIDNQFRFHYDTSQLGKNMHNINPDDIISITYKIHGTSFISSKLLCKRKLNIFEKLIKKLGVKIQENKYDNIYSSRKVIKNDDFNIIKNNQHYYNEDVWKSANDIVLNYIDDGMTIYGEIVGYLNSGSYIQKDYDYGYTSTKFNEKYQEGINFGIYVYRITYTNISGKVFEFSAKQVQNWCKLNGLKPVLELFYGKAKDYLSINNQSEDEWRINFLKKLENDYHYKECILCQNRVPAEGVVVRKEELDFNAFKHKSFEFYAKESKELNSDTIDIETMES